MNKENFQKVLDKIQSCPTEWKQSTWHSDCGTKHCFAGWGQLLSGRAANDNTVKKDARLFLQLSPSEANYLFEGSRTLQDFIEFLAGYNSDGYNIAGYNIAGYDIAGYDRAGYNIAGYDRAGYDRAGYDIAGYDRAGYNIAGYDRAGYDRAGYDRAGYNRAGYNIAGYDSDGYNIAGYDSDGLIYQDGQYIEKT